MCTHTHTHTHTHTPPLIQQDRLTEWDVFLWGVWASRPGDKWICQRRRSEDAVCCRLLIVATLRCAKGKKKRKMKDWYFVTCSRKGNEYSPAPSRYSWRIHTWERVWVLKDTTWTRNVVFGEKSAGSKHWIKSGFYLGPEGVEWALFSACNEGGSTTEPFKAFSTNMHEMNISCFTRRPSREAEGFTLLQMAKWAFFFSFPPSCVFVLNTSTPPSSCCGTQVTILDLIELSLHWHLLVKSPCHALLSVTAG